MHYLHGVQQVWLSSKRQTTFFGDGVVRKDNVLVL